MRAVTKADCVGCYNDFYNGKGGNSKECWLFKKAVMEEKILIHVDQPPPYKQKPALVPSCKTVQRFVLVKPEALDAQGFWRR